MKFDPDDIKKLWKAAPESHKGQNGRVLVIGGSEFFHAASLWSLTTASRLVDLVHYASVPDNNQIVQKAKEEFRNGIVIPRSDIEAYINEDDAVLIGPGMVRDGKEGEETKELTNNLLKKYPEKKWVIDAGALQMVDISVLPERSILTPHHKEFEGLIERSGIKKDTWREQLESFSLQTKTIVLLKGKVDYVCDGLTGEIVEINGGNEGMTKGGTGDVLAGLVVGLFANNDAYLAASLASFINKQAGDDLYTIVGPYFNATDLANQIPNTMKRLLSYKVIKEKMCEYR